MARFSKVFELITVVLLVAVVNVYVMGAPKVGNEPSKGDTAKTTTEAKATTGTEAPTTPVAPLAVAADKLPLAPGSKINFNRIFSKTEISSRAASSPSFLNAKVAARDVFKAPPRTGTVPPDDQNNGGGGNKGTWIAVGVITAALTILVIHLRTERDN